MLSGLEVCVFSDTDMNKMQAHADQLARRVLGRTGWGAVAESTEAKNVPSKWVPA